MDNRADSPSGLFRPVDAAFLVAFRIGFGVLMTWEMTRLLTSGWVQSYWIEPDFFFTWRGFDWVRPWPGSGMVWHVVLTGAAAACVALGLHTRLAATALALGFTYLFLLDKANYLNHFYLIAWFAALMPLLPAGRAFSLDARRAPHTAVTHVPAWTLWALRALTGVPYLMGGVAKLHPDWLAGEPIRTWLAARADAPLIGPLLAHPAAVWFFGAGGLVFDLAIVPLLLIRRTRPLALGLVLFFHLANATLFPIGVFPWFMLMATLVFCPPDWPRRVLALVTGEPAAAEPVRAPAPPSRPARLAIAAAFAALLAFHLLFPLRHYLYAGDVHWTEQGHRFAWHMMLRAKDGQVRYFVTLRNSTLVVDPATLLSERQAMKMATRPDMILAFAHHLARRYTAPSGKRPVVRAEAIVALNHDPPALMIDPYLDLASVPRDADALDFVLPRPSPPGADPRAAVASRSAPRAHRSP